MILGEPIMKGFKFFIIITLSYVSYCHASPQLPQVMHGDVVIVQEGINTTIQASHNSVIHFESFDIASNESVHFVQPDAQSKVLNRIESAMPTHIDGLLHANGIVYLVNPCGIIFSDNAIIDVGAIFAAAAKISDQDFLQSIDRFTDMNGDIINQGAILSDTFVHLIGKHIANFGEIVAGKGVSAFTTNDGNLLIGQAGGHVFLILENHNPSSEEFVNQDGVIGSSDLLSLAIENKGRIRSEDCIVFASDAIAEIGGVVDVSNATPGAQGGSIQLYAEELRVVGAVIDASGDAGGGVILCGGDYKGENSVFNATRTLVDSDTVVRANAYNHGDGGRIILWSEEHTFFNGLIQATGGQLAGDGGFIETSGKGQLTTHFGDVDVGAINGFGGTWLLDPTTINIAAGGTGTLAEVNTFPPVAGGTVNLPVALINSFNGTNLIVACTADLNITAAILNPLAFNAFFYGGTQVNISQNFDLRACAVTLQTADAGAVAFNFVAAGTVDVHTLTINTGTGGTTTLNDDITFTLHERSGVAGTAVFSTAVTGVGMPDLTIAQAAANATFPIATFSEAVSSLGTFAANGNSTFNSTLAANALIFNGDATQTVNTTVTFLGNATSTQNTIGPGFFNITNINVGTAAIPAALTFAYLKINGGTPTGANIRINGSITGTHAQNMADVNVATTTLLGNTTLNTSVGLSSGSWGAVTGASFDLILSGQVGINSATLRDMTVTGTGLFSLGDTIIARNLTLQGAIGYNIKANSVISGTLTSTTTGITSLSANTQLLGSGTITNNVDPAASINVVLGSGPTSTFTFGSFDSSTMAGNITLNGNLSCGGAIEFGTLSVAGNSTITMTAAGNMSIETFRETTPSTLTIDLGAFGNNLINRGTGAVGPLANLVITTDGRWLISSSNASSITNFTANLPTIELPNSQPFTITETLSGNQALSFTTPNNDNATLNLYGSSNITSNINFNRQGTGILTVNLGRNDSSSIVFATTGSITANTGTIVRPRGLIMTICPLTLDQIVLNGNGSLNTTNNALVINNSITELSPTTVGGLTINTGTANTTFGGSNVDITNMNITANQFSLTTAQTFAVDNFTCNITTTADFNAGGAAVPLVFDTVNITAGTSIDYGTNAASIVTINSGGSFTTPVLTNSPVAGSIFNTANTATLSFFQTPTITFANMITAQGTIQTDGRILALNAITIPTGAALNLNTVNGSAGAAIQLNAAVTGAGSLVANAGTGDVTIAANIGIPTPLRSVSFSGGKIDLGADISTNGSTMIFNNNLIISTNVSLTETGGGAITFHGTIEPDNNATRAFTLTNADGAINFNKSIIRESVGNNRLVTINILDVNTLISKGNINVAQFTVAQVTGAGDALLNSITTSGTAGTPGTMGGVVRFLPFVGEVKFTGDILTIGGDTTNAGGTGAAGGPIYLQSNTASIIVNKIDTSGGNATGGGATTGGAAGVVTLTPNGATGLGFAQGDFPVGRIGIFDSIIARGGTGATLGANATVQLQPLGNLRTNFQSIATIYGNPNGANLTIVCDMLQFGPFDSITSIGDLSITMGAAQTYSAIDTVAGGSVSISALNYAPQLHPPYQILASNGELYTNHANHIIAGRNMNLPVPTATVGTGNTPYNLAFQFGANRLQSFKNSLLFANDPLNFSPKPIDTSTIFVPVPPFIADSAQVGGSAMDQGVISDISEAVENNDEKE